MAVILSDQSAAKGVEGPAVAFLVLHGSSPWVPRPRHVFVFVARVGLDKTPPRALYLGTTSVVPKTVRKEDGLQPLPRFFAHPNRSQRYASPVREYPRVAPGETRGKHLQSDTPSRRAGRKPTNHRGSIAMSGPQNLLSTLTSPLRSLSEMESCAPFIAAFSR